MYHPSSLANEIEDVIRRELDDAERAIKADRKNVALSEIDDAVRKLKQIARKVRHLNAS
jgi:hypothetical protein